MPVTVNVNDLSVVHQTSNGIATATVPDVCKTPSAAGPVPIPYPNIAMSSDLVSGTTTVTVDGSPAAIQSSKFVKSSGDEAGVAGGVASSVFMMEATFLSFSPTVTFDGQPACRLTDKMLMNKGNTVCMAGVCNPLVSTCGPDSSSAASSSSVSSTPAPPPEAPKLCTLSSLTIMCDHGSRSLSPIELMNDPSAAPLQVISAPDKIDTVVLQWVGTCAFNHPFCPAVMVQDDDGKITAVNRSQGTFAVPPQSHPAVHDWLSVFKLLAWQKDLPSADYTVYAALCQGHDRADLSNGRGILVEAFPKAEWKADFSIGYKHKNKERENDEGKKEEDPFNYEPDATWSVGGSAEATLGTDKFSYALDAGVKADSLPLFGSLLSKIGKMSKIFESMADNGINVKLEPKWPQWKFSGGLKLIELKGKRIVGSEGSFKFGFDPLFGMGMEVSILDWIIRFAASFGGGPLLADFLVEVRKGLKEGGGSKSSVAQGKLDIDILFRVEGEIKGGWGLKFADGKSETDSEASCVEASMSLGIEGHVIGTGRIWRVEATAAAIIGSTGADGKDPSKDASKVTGTLRPKGGKNPFAMSGQLVFSGLALVYLLYYELGVKSEETSKKEEEDDPDKSRKMGFKNRKEKTAKCVLLEEWKHPKSEGGGGE